MTNLQLELVKKKNSQYVQHKHKISELESKINILESDKDYLNKILT